MIYKFHRIDPSKNIDIFEDCVKEAWSWEAEYTDDTVLKQFEDLPDGVNGIFHQFAEIDQSKLRAFVMHNESTGQRYILLFPAKAKLIHFYRRTRLNAGTEQEKQFTIYIFGYELPHYNMYFMIMPDGNIIATENMNLVEMEASV